jgi:hypothetical protein
MRYLRYWVVAFILLQMGCTGLRVPKERIDRTSNSFERDLSNLRDYLGSMPVDVAVAGYTPEVTNNITIEVSQDSTQSLMQDVVITQLDPLYTYVRGADSKPSETIRIPTQNVTSVSAYGVRTTTEPKQVWTYTFSVILALMALGFFLYDFNRDLGWGCEGGCMALAIVTGGAALIAALTVYLVNTSSNDGQVRREMISKTFRLE